MFEPGLDPQSGEPQPRRFTASRLLSLSVAGVLCSIGICGAGAMLHMRGVTPRIATLGAIVLLASLLGLIVGALWALGAAMFGRKR
jgi:hypothetical protein